MLAPAVLSHLSHCCTAREHCSVLAAPWNVVLFTFASPSRALVLAISSRCLKQSNWTRPPEETSADRSFVCR